MQLVSQHVADCFFETKNQLLWIVIGVAGCTGTFTSAPIADHITTSSESLSAGRSEAVDRRLVVD